MIIALVAIGAVTATIMAIAVYELRRANREMRAVYNKLHDIERALTTPVRKYGEPTAYIPTRRSPQED